MAGFRVPSKVQASEAARMRKLLIPNNTKRSSSRLRRSRSPVIPFDPR
ncbi:MAG: hypothetical protein HC830_13530 [Bacteroidetes bacterium]|nr:hypothetical protein [Bacteroidota bacterium]